LDGFFAAHNARLQAPWNSSLFAALELKTNRVIGNSSAGIARWSSASSSIPSNRRCQPGLDVHLIVDNYATHKTAIIRKWFAKRSHFHVHFTPTYGSWINLVERWFAELTNKRIRRGVFRSVKGWRPLSANTSRSTTKISRPLSGPEPQTRSWLALLATPNARPDLSHEPLGQETRIEQMESE